MDRQVDEAFRVLGIPADSDRETVASAYRRLARATHPDVSRDPDAAQRFATVSAAYRLVSEVPHLRPHPRLGSEEDAASTYSPLRWAAPPTDLCEPEGLADDWSDPASDPGDVRLLPGVSPFGSGLSWRRPHIVAGPTVFRRAQPDAGRRSGGG